MDFETVSGITLHLRAVPFAKVAAARAAIQWPARPTYTVALPGGESQTFEHNETTLSDEADKVRWRAYLRDTARAENDWNETLTQLLLWFGVTGLDIPTGWEQAQALFGIKIPTEAPARKAHYILTEIVGGVEEQRLLLKTIMQLGNVSEEELSAAIAGFRRQLAGATAGQTTPHARPVAERESLRGDGRGQPLALDAGRMG